MRWRGYRPDNPAAGLKAPKDRTDPAEESKALTPGAARRLLASLPGDTDRAKRDRALVLAFVLHGPRVAELAGLRLADVDLVAGTVQVMGKGDKRRAISHVHNSRGARGLAEGVAGVRS